MLFRVVMRHVTLALILFSLACSKGKLSTPPSDETPSETSTPASETPPATPPGEAAEDERATITLVDPGAEPRRPLLRTAFPATDTIKIRSQITMIADMGAGGENKTVIPPVVHTVALKTRKMLSDEGDGIMTFEVTGSEVLPDKEAKAEVVEKIQESADSIRGLNGTFRFDRQGVITNVEITAPPADKTRDPHMGASIGEFLYRSAVPVPSEPVGKGAKWTVKRRLKEGGILLDQTVRYELEKIAGSIATVAVEIEKGAPPQKVGAPNEYDLNVFTAEGSGRSDVDLGRLVAQLATSKTETHIKMSAPGPSGTSVESDLTAYAEERISRPE